MKLRELDFADEAAFIAAHRAMEADAYTFGLSYETGMSWSAYLERLEFLRRGVDLPVGIVPSTLLVADVDGEIVGRTSIRFGLNEFLAREGGHIGYCVLAEHRRRGYATEILRQSLEITRSAGIDRVLVTCDEDNVGSAAVIERCGGVFESIIDSSRGGPPKRRFWID